MDLCSVAAMNKYRNHGNHKAQKTEVVARDFSARDSKYTKYEDVKVDLDQDWADRVEAGLVFDTAAREQAYYERLEEEARAAELAEATLDELATKVARRLTVPAANRPGRARQPFYAIAPKSGRA